VTLKRCTQLALFATQNRSAYPSGIRTPKHSDPKWFPIPTRSEILLRS